MQKLIKERLKVIEQRRKKYRQIMIVTAFFSVVVIGGVVWGLGRPGVAMTGKETCGIEEHKHDDKCYKDILVCGETESEGHQHGESCYKEEKVLVCGQEESEEHTHSNDCYEKQVELTCRKDESEGHKHSNGCYEEELDCKKEEHIHEDDCYIDVKADIEKPSEWDKQYKDIKWKDAWGADLVIAAKEQVGYKESAKNYQKAADGSHKGYTRYGHFSGEEYADWDASFVNFCIYYAGLSETDIFPNAIDTTKWYNKFHKVNGNFLTSTDDYEPEAGDIIFFEKKNEETDFQMGIVSSYNKEKKEIKVIEGNSGNAVKENKYSTNDKQIFAYIRISAVEEAYKGSQKPDDAKELDEEIPDTQEPGEIKEPADEDGTDGETNADNPEATDNPDGNDSEETQEPGMDAEQTTDGTETENQPEYICGKEEHTHDESCYDINGGFTCGKEEHTHDESCLKAADEENAPKEEEAQKNVIEKDNNLYLNEDFEYKIDSFRLTFHVKGKAALPEQEETESGEAADAGTTDDAKTSEQESGAEVSATENGQEDEGSEPESKAADDESQAADIQQQSSGESVKAEPEKSSVKNSEGDTQEADAGENSQPEEQTFDKDNGAGTENSGNVSEDSGKLQTSDNVQSADEQADVKEGLEFKVENLDESSEGYQAFADYAVKEEEGYEQILLQVMQYSLLYGGEELDLSECEVTAEIAPTEELKEHVEEAEAAKETENASKKSEKNTVDDQSESESGDEIIISAYGLLKDTQVELGAAVVKSDEIGTESQVMTVAPRNGVMALSAQSTPNPTFTVQYYANLERVEMLDSIPSGANANHYLPVINTEGKGTPKNGEQPEVLYLTPKDINSKERQELRTKSTLTKIYADRTDQTYYKQPNINYLNALIKNDSYEMEEIWIYRPEESHTETGGLLCGEENHSTHTPECYKGNWGVYTFEEGKTHFTNREEVADKVYEDGTTYIWISDNATIRFIYEPESQNKKVPASFYDYDISQHDSRDTATIMANTRNGGINAADRTSSEGAKYAFGNSNAGTDYGEEVWRNNGLDNKLNKSNKDNGYMGCTFGLAAGINNHTDSEKMNVQFAEGVNAPKNLFGDGTANGKYRYGGDLTYTCSGDTYTLMAAKVGNNEFGSLNTFEHLEANAPWLAEKIKHIWTNSFWPMDKAPAENREDILFGSSSNTKKYIDEDGKPQNLPLSDDTKDHNSYFGMSYQVEFELSEEYVGPLEYYFFGDDDMWVFLDGERLVCDIGGVHSSVGEYVNLWDYLNQGEAGKHTLSFFYTERGASGSTCWMQFTLPSVTTSQQTTPEDYGRLKVQKSVVQNGKEGLYQGDDEFEFEIRLRLNENTPLPDDYSYTKYNKDGTTTSDLILNSGSTFTLKNGEYILVEYIPKDAEYIITEKSGVVQIGDVSYECDTDIKIGNTSVSGEALEDKKASGTITSNGTGEIQYINSFDLYELPSTGSYGIYGFIFGGILLLLMAGTALIVYKCKYGEVLQR